MYQSKISPDTIDWISTDFPGVTMQTLYADTKTGAMIVLTKMEAGSTIPKHQHTHADETVYVVSGDFIEDEESFGPGALFVGKKLTDHGPHQTHSGCTVLTHFSATLDFKLAS